MCTKLWSKYVCPWGSKKRQLYIFVCVYITVNLLEHTRCLGDLLYFFFLKNILGMLYFFFFMFVPIFILCMNFCMYDLRARMIVSWKQQRFNVFLKEYSNKRWIRRDKQECNVHERWRYFHGKGNERLYRYFSVLQNVQMWSHATVAWYLQSTCILFDFLWLVQSLLFL